MKIQDHDQMFKKDIKNSKNGIPRVNMIKKKSSMIQKEDEKK